VGWVFLGADAGSIDEEAEPKALKSAAFASNGTEYGRNLSESKVTSCSHGQLAAVANFQVV
jgi:hypothetical protein